MLWLFTLQVLYECKLCLCEELSKENCWNEWKDLSMTHYAFQIFFLFWPGFLGKSLSLLIHKSDCVVSDEKVLVNFNGNSYLLPIIQHCLWNHLSRSFSSYLAFTSNARSRICSQSWTAALNVGWWRWENLSKVFRGSDRVKKLSLLSFRIFS